MVVFKAVKDAIDNAKTITILSHLNPDADTLGTALGIYSLLIQDRDKKVEVVNASDDLPHYLNFLPYYQKIKHTIEYEDSLIITCDCGSLDRLGFDVSGRDIINIDHHKSNTQYGFVNIVIPEYASASQVAYELFHQFYELNRESATCFYAALLSDTQYFTTESVTEKTFDIAKALIGLGAKPADIAYHFTQKRALSGLRILERALRSLRLKEEARIATMSVSYDDIEATGATISDLDGLVDYAKSLTTVEIAICAMELPSGVRISLRSKSIDISCIAMAFGGGGHKGAAGFTFTQYSLQESMDIILDKIKVLGLLKKSN